MITDSSWDSWLFFFGLGILSPVEWNKAPKNHGPASQDGLPVAEP